MRQHKRGVAAEVAFGNHLEEQPPPTHAKSVALVDIIGTLSAISISRSAGKGREKKKGKFPRQLIPGQEGSGIGGGKFPFKGPSTDWPAIRGPHLPLFPSPLPLIRGTVAELCV